MFIGSKPFPDKTRVEKTDTAQLLIFLGGVDDDMNITNKILDLQSIKGQTRETDLFLTVCSAVDNLKLSWRKLLGLLPIMHLPCLVNEVDFPH